MGLFYPSIYLRHHYYQVESPPSVTCRTLRYLDILYRKSVSTLTLPSSVVAMIVTSVLLATGIRQIARDSVTSFAALWDRGFGSIDVECLVLLNSLSPVKTSLLSNTPQLIVSIIYTTVNGMWTAMMVGNEWNGYGLRKKSLRTTAAVGRQRSSYWLSLPLVSSRASRLPWSPGSSIANGVR